METPKAVGIWVRVSTEDQLEGDSPEHHEARARMYAELKGWEVAKVYDLSNWSGKSIEDHPETNRMMEDVRKGVISGLLFSKLARVARNTKELLELADFFQEHSADLISLQEAIDTSTPAGRLLYTVIAALAEWERNEIADRVRASIPIRAKLGKSLGGAIPYGYMKDGQKLALHPEEAPVRKLMFELYLKYKRKLTVANELNERGFRTRIGKKFSDRGVDRLLRDPIAKGMRRMNYTKSMGKNKRWELKPEEEWIMVPAPAIVSEEVWYQVNVLLNANSNPRPTGKRTAHVFTGLVFCSCGEKMYAKTNHPKYNCTKCKNRIGTDDLEEIFQVQLQNFIVSPEQISTELSKFQALISEKEILLEKLTKNRTESQKKIDTLLELVQTGEIPKDGFKEYYQPHYERLKQIDRELPLLQGEIDAMRVQLNSSEYILSEAKALQEKWPLFSFAEKRSIAEAVVNRIVIDKEDISIELIDLPSASKRTEKVDTTMPLRLLQSPR